MVSPLGSVLDLPVRPPVVDETFFYQILPGLIELRAAYAQNLRDRSIRIKTSPLPVSHHHQKQIEDHRFMA
jgi:hypothetical protein